MSTFPTSVPLAPALLALGALALGGCEVNLNTEGFTSKDTRTFQVSGAPELTIETFDGAIEIHSWDRREVEVQIEKRAMDQSLIDGMTVEAEQQGDRVTLRVTGPSRVEPRGFTVGYHISTAARLLVAVPRESHIVARTDDGAIRIEDVSGRVSLRTGDGRVTVERVSGELEVRTGDGAIRVERAEGRLDLETSDGGITVEARPAALRVKSGDGTIRVQVHGDSVMADNWDIETGDGSVTLTLPAAFAADLDAETRDGSVRVSHPAIADDADEGGRRERRRELKTRLGDGGRLLKIRTGDGTIRIES
jgi:DUF4097 and DUF4098 domain-containing protein YvlB